MLKIAFGGARPGQPEAGPEQTNPGSFDRDAEHLPPSVHLKKPSQEACACSTILIGENRTGDAKPKCEAVAEKVNKIDMQHRNNYHSGDHIWTDQVHLCPIDGSAYGQSAY